MKKNWKRGSVKSVLLTMILILLILGMAAVLFYMLYGERILPRFEISRNGISFIGADGGGYQEQSGGNTDSAPDSVGDDGTVASEPAMEFPAENDMTESVPDTGISEPESVPETPPQETPVQESQPVQELPAPDYNQINNMPAGLSISPYDFTVRTLGEVTRLIPAGNPAATQFSWVSKNPAVATVDQNGNVTAISNGVTTILVTDGQRKGEAIVRIYSGSGNDAGSENQLNNTDFTRSVSEGGYQLRVSGIESGISWRSTNPDVATVSETGFVTPVAPGTTTIIASWGDQSRVCTVRVPSASP